MAPQFQLAATALFSGLALAAADGRADPSDVSAPSFVVELADGRRVTGELDSKTDQLRLWVRRSSSGVTIQSGFAWDSIDRLQYGGAAVSPAELRLLAGQQQARQRELAEGISEPPAGAGLELPRVAVLGGQDRTAQVASLRIEAWLANWDQDPQPDGLSVFVFPLDAAGRLVPVHGNLDFTLVGATQIVGGTSWQKTPQFPELERKSHVVRRGDFAEGPAVYKVPFVRVEPEYDMRLAWPGLLFARLRVPSVGAFDASTTCLELREFSPLRDHLLQHTGRRYLPLEDAGRSGR